MSLKLNGATSGYVEIDAPAVAGSTSITLPATSGGEFVVTDSNGRLGLGTSSPAANLHVKGNNIIQYVEATGTAAEICFRNNTSTGDNIRIGGSGNNLTFDTGGAESMRIDSSGNVGIGTTTPLASAGFTGITTSGSTGGILWFAKAGAQKGYIYGQDNDVTLASTDGSGVIRFLSGGNTERARIDSSGRLLVGTSSSSLPTGIQIQGYAGGTTGQGILTLSRGAALPSSGATLGDIRFYDNGSGYGARIEATTDGPWASSDYPTRLAFSTTADGASVPTERMRINWNGDIRIGQTTTSQPGDNNNTTGICFRSDNGSASNNGRFYASAGADHNLNRTSDGVILAFRSAGTNEGAVSISGTTVTYGGGHLARWSQLLNNADPSGILKGTVMSNLDEMCEWGEEDNEQLNRTKVSDVEGDSNVAGVFVSTSFNDEGPFDFYVGMTGDMVIRIAQGTTVARGDLLMSAGDGTAKPQGDDIIRSKTIAKVTSTHVSETYDDGSYCVPCVLMAC